MKIGIWSDDHNFPNLVLMKLSAFYKGHGDTVEKLNHLNDYDIVYCSKVFDFTPDVEDEAVVSADRIIRAGTGYHDYRTVLPPEIEHISPDYSLYPQFSQAYGYLNTGMSTGMSLLHRITKRRTQEPSYGRCLGILAWSARNQAARP